MKLRNLNESYPDIPRGWEIISFDNDEEFINGDEHGLFYHDDENLLVEVYCHWDEKIVDIRVYAGDTVAYGELITSDSHDVRSTPDYHTILSNIENCIDSIYDKFYDYGIGTIYQVLDKTCSIRDDIRDIISKKL